MGKPQGPQKTLSGFSGCPCVLSGKMEVHGFLIFFNKTSAFGMIKNFERAIRIWV
jgi:hypothetical protein